MPQIEKNKLTPSCRREFKKLKKREIKEAVKNKNNKQITKARVGFL